jgi:hypothetical protein
MTNTQQAHAAGYTAAQAGEPRAPALNKAYMAMIATLSTPDFANHKEIMAIGNAFIKGYEMHVNEVCAALLAA